MRYRRGLRRIRVVFTGDHLMRFGGVLLLHCFLQRLQLRRRFREDVRFPQRNNTYSIPEMLLALLYPSSRASGGSRPQNCCSAMASSKTLTAYIPHFRSMIWCTCTESRSTSVHSL